MALRLRNTNQLLVSLGIMDEWGEYVTELVPCRPLPKEDVLVIPVSVTGWSL